MTGDQRVTLTRAAERILPGAEEAQLIGYIEGALASEVWAGRRPAVLEGAATLDRVAQEGWRQSFSEPAPTDRDEVLTHVQNTGADTDDFDGAAFLHALIELCLEGFLGDPAHGGNHNQAGWRYIGFVPGCPRH